MILVIDIGNTNIVLGVFNKNKLLGNWRMLTSNSKSSDEYGIFIHSLLKFNDIDSTQITDIIISSVVPDIMHSVTNAMRKYFRINPLIVGPGIKTGIILRAENPKEVGADRIVNAVAAYELYGGPLITIDFGTATTFDVITDKAEFIAAVTCPGLQISADALWTRAAQLPNVEIKKPPSILARNTVTSMQAGLIYGTIGQVEYIIARIKEEMNDTSIKTVATGGFGGMISKETSSIDIYDRLLLLKGLKIICDKNIKTY